MHNSSNNDDYGGGDVDRLLLPLQKKMKPQQQQQQQQSPAAPFLVDNAASPFFTDVFKGYLKVTLLLIHSNGKTRAMMKASKLLTAFENAFIVPAIYLRDTSLQAKYVLALEGAISKSPSYVGSEMTWLEHMAKLKIFPHMQAPDMDFEAALAVEGWHNVPTIADLSNITVRLAAEGTVLEICVAFE
jgi:hypothetical protein